MNAWETPSLERNHYGIAAVAYLTDEKVSMVYRHERAFLDETFTPTVLKK
jgi:hypothetical protein